MLHASLCQSFAGFALLVPADLEPVLNVDLVASRLTASVLLLRLKLDQTGNIVTSNRESIHLFCEFFSHDVSKSLASQDIRLILANASTNFVA